jgi:spore germination protein
MHIHTVRPGDTVFKIAREYSTSPIKIIENNELTNPDSLTVGQKLLILNPTRTYTVRGQDTLMRIADRFGVKYNSLLSGNPYLAGGNKLYPGQLLAIKYDAPKYGIASANGYYYKGTSRDRLSFVMPYLTYLTVAAGKRDGENVKLLFDDTDIVDEAKKNGKIPLMRVYDENTDFSEAYADSLLLMAKSHGYGGLTLAAYKAMRESAEPLAEFLINLKKRMMECDMLLFTEMDGNSNVTFPDVCDGYIIMYEKCCLEDIPTFDQGERKLMERFSTESEPSKAYLDIATYGYMGNEEITKSEADRLARTSGAEISNDSERGICYFTYNKYIGGKKETVKVAYESLENIKAKLDLAGELGFMGISFDIMNIPTEYLMLYETMFSHPSGYLPI